MGYTIVAMYGIAAQYDYRQREVPVWIPLVFGVVVVICGVLGHTFDVSSVGGAVMGCGLFLLSKCREQDFGTADASLLTVSGIALGGRKNLQLFFLALLLAALIGGVFCLFSKKKADRTMPFVPFLLAATVILCGLEVEP